MGLRPDPPAKENTLKAATMTDATMQKARWVEVKHCQGATVHVPSQSNSSDTMVTRGMYSTVVDSFAVALSACGATWSAHSTYKVRAGGDGRGITTDGQKDMSRCWLQDSAA
jgi:hypothetical protein